MIEEAAGTRLYESKKEAAQKTIEKKDAKLREIDTVNILINDHVNILNSQEFFVRLVNINSTDTRYVLLLTISINRIDVEIMYK
jgi:hypothetical protein